MCSLLISLTCFYESNVCVRAFEKLFMQSALLEVKIAILLYRWRFLKFKLRSMIHRNKMLKILLAQHNCLQLTKFNSDL